MAFHFPGQRYTGVHLIRELTQDQFDLIENTIAHEKCNVLDTTVLERRIGSNSEAGIVFEAELDIHGNKIPIAIKFVTNTNEASQEFQMANAVPEYYYFLSTLFLLNCNVDLYGKISVMSVIGMELAVGDIGQVVKYTSVSCREVDMFVYNVMESVELLAESFVYHGDLHHQNVFIVSRGGEYRAVIGDFGKSYFSVSATIHLNDLVRFLEDFSRRGLSSKYSNIIVKLNKLVTMLYPRMRQNEDHLSDLESKGTVNTKPFIKNLIANDMKEIKAWWLEN